MNDVPPPPLPQSPKVSPFAKVAAIFSLFAPVAVILIYIILFTYIRFRVGTQQQPLGLLAFAVLVFLPLLLIPAGVALGIVALVSAKRPEYKRVHGMAVVGICVNCLFLLVSIFPALFAVLLGPAFVNVWRQMAAQ